MKDSQAFNAEKPLVDALQDNVREYTVSELSLALKRVVEDAYPHVRVRGEISGFKRAASGHVYLTLKDEEAALDAVMWRGTAGVLRFAPEDGLEVVCTGRLTTYPGRSRYQLVIERMEPAGIGALMALLEERKKKLAAEGLFDPARKKPLPFLPDVIGVVTSPTGAVIRDILHRLAERFPRHVVVWPVVVQGERAAAEVAAAIAGFNRLKPGGAVPRPDLLIVARGGGSIEDLWAFNEEIVVRAAAASAIPLISAVGHETDITLIDFAADKRAPTPTAAAEMAVPVRAEILARVLEQAARLIQGEARCLAEGRSVLSSFARALRRPSDLLALARQRFDGAAERLLGGLRENLRQHELRLVANVARLRRGAIEADIGRARARLLELSTRSRDAAWRNAGRAGEQLRSLAKLLSSVSHEAVLERGFALVHGQDGALIRRRAETKAGLAVEIEFSDGRAPAVIGGEGAGKRLRPKQPGFKGSQGSLF
jgi:exodeoxyribonuclease VII large subunit